MKEATTRNYYEQRRKQKQEKVKERDEEKERLPAKGGRSGTTKTRALDDAAEDVIDADAMQTIREATILEKPLGRLEEGSGGRFAFPEEESSTSAHTADVPALQPCAGGAREEFTMEEQKRLGWKRRNDLKGKTCKRERRSLGN